MKLYVIRHGIAEAGGPGLADEDRRLTEAGREELRRSVEGLAAFGLRLDTVLTSPLVRARETAALVRKGIPGPAPALLPDLAPGGDLAQVLRAAEGAGERVAVVGHEPGLGCLVSLALLGSETDATPLRKGGVVCLRFRTPPRPGRAELVWALTPRLLRHLG